MCIRDSGDRMSGVFAALGRVSRSEPASVWAAFGSLLGPVRWEGAEPGRRCLLVGGVLARNVLDEVSWLAVQCCTDGLACGEADRTDLACLEVSEVGPVSYTHLTLPTILR